LTAEADRAALPSGYYLVGVTPAAAAATFQQLSADVGSMTGLVRKAAADG
jgi:hypothetical protein